MCCPSIRSFARPGHRINGKATRTPPQRVKACSIQPSMTSVPAPGAAPEGSGWTLPRLSASLGLLHPKIGNRSMKAYLPRELCVSEYAAMQTHNFSCPINPILREQVLQLATFETNLGQGVCSAVHPNWAFPALQKHLSEARSCALRVAQLCPPSIAGTKTEALAKAFPPSSKPARPLRPVLLSL
jgi:hypothetical protein